MIGVTVVGCWALIDLAGEFDLSNSAEIVSVANHLVGQGVSDVSVDMCHVSFLGVAGLDALETVARMLGATNGRMVIVGAVPSIRRLLALTGLDHALGVFDPPPASKLGLPGADAGRVGSNGSTITENLRRVANRAVQDVPGCSAASVALLAHGDAARTAAVSNALAIEVDVVQYTLDEGPCLQAARISQPVRADLGRDDKPFIRFAPLARQRGIHGVLSIPLRDDSRTFGTLNLYSAVLSQAPRKQRRPSPPKPLQPHQDTLALTKPSSNRAPKQSETG